MKILRFVVLALLAVFALTACSSIQQGAVTLPPEAQTNINLLAVAVLALVSEWIVARVPWLKFLASYAQEWGMLLGAVAAKFLSEWLPGGVWETASLSFLNSIIVLAFILIGRKLFRFVKS